MFRVEQDCLVFYGGLLFLLFYMAARKRVGGPSVLDEAFEKVGMASRAGRKVSQWLPLSIFVLVKDYNLPR